MTAALAFLRIAAGWLWSFLRGLPWWAWLAMGALLAGVVYGESRYRAGVAEQSVETEAARQSAAECVALAATNMQTIRKLQTANAEWARRNAADMAAGAEAVAAVERERDALQAELRKRRADRDRLYDHDETAAAWGRAVVPAGVAAGLRK